MSSSGYLLSLYFHSFACHSHPSTWRSPSQCERLILTPKHELREFLPKYAAASIFQRLYILRYAVFHLIVFYGVKNKPIRFEFRIIYLCTALKVQPLAKTSFSYGDKSNIKLSVVCQSECSPVLPTNQSGLLASKQ